MSITLSDAILGRKQLLSVATFTHFLNAAQGIHQVSFEPGGRGGIQPHFGPLCDSHSARQNMCWQQHASKYHTYFQWKRPPRVFVRISSSLFFYWSWLRLRIPPSTSKSTPSGNPLFARRRHHDFYSDHAEYITIPASRR